MSIVTLTEDERLLLEVIEALGGEARSHVLTALARLAIRHDVLQVLIDLTHAGLLLGTATGRFTLTEAGRRAVSGSDQSGGRLTSWQRKQIPETARALSRRTGKAGPHSSRASCGKVDPVFRA